MFKRWMETGQNSETCGYIWKQFVTLRAATPQFAAQWTVPSCVAVLLEIRMMWLAKLRMNFPKTFFQIGRKECLQSSTCIQEL